MYACHSRLQDVVPLGCHDDDGTRSPQPSEDMAIQRSRTLSAFWGAIRFLTLPEFRLPSGLTLRDRHTRAIFCQDRPIGGWSGNHIRAWNPRFQILKVVPGDMTSVPMSCRPGPWDEVLLAVWPIQSEPVCWPPAMGIQGDAGIEAPGLRLSPPGRVWRNPWLPDTMLFLNEDHRAAVGGPTISSRAEQPANLLRERQP